MKRVEEARKALHEALQPTFHRFYLTSMCPETVFMVESALAQAKRLVEHKFPDVIIPHTRVYFRDDTLFVDAPVEDRFEYESKR